MGEEIENGTIHVGEIIGKTLDGKDIYKFTELGIAENVKIIAPQYKDGDFVVNVREDIIIFKNKTMIGIYDHAYLERNGIIWIRPESPTSPAIKRHATEEEKHKMLDALAKEGKRWNAEKLCVEDIPKFRVGDKVRIKAGVSSKTHRNIAPLFVEEMDGLIGKTMTVNIYIGGNNCVECEGICWSFHEDWLEPCVEELKEGDLAIFWDNGAQHRASVRMYGGLFMRDYCDTGGVRWDNAIKFESKEQYEKLINGEL